MKEENKLRVALLTNSLQAWEIEPLKFAERVTPPHWETKLSIGDSDLGDMSCCDLVILGCGRAQEQVAYRSRIYGVVSVRYSIYYAMRSPYTGSFLEEDFSFDIPKERPILKKFLDNEDINLGILKKNANQVREALKEINQGVSRPILTTDILEYTLRNRK